MVGKNAGDQFDHEPDCLLSRVDCRVSTVESVMILDLAWRRPCIWSCGMVLIKVESAINRPYPYEWLTEWEDTPWRKRVAHVWP
jgi:hypothetical protein